MVISEAALDHFARQLRELQADNRRQWFAIEALLLRLPDPTAPLYGGRGRPRQTVREEGKAE